jgi:hypothetical protein
VVHHRGGRRPARLRFLASCRDRHGSEIYCCRS